MSPVDWTPASASRRHANSQVDGLAAGVYSLILRLVGQVQVAQETAQEVFMSLWREARDFDRSRGSVKSWILSLAHHKGVDAVRRCGYAPPNPCPSAAR